MNRNEIDVWTADRLRSEARYLHRLLFKSEIVNEMTDSYVLAHEFIKPSGSNEQLRTVQLVIDNGLDAEAVELALRKSHPRHPLRQKMQILTYLAEADQLHYSFFINTDNSFVKAILSLTGQIFRTIGKLLLGKLLVWRYNLV